MEHLERASDICFNRVSDLGRVLIWFFEVVVQ